MVTPIERVTFTYSIGGASKNHTVSVQITQFPMKLAWGVTAHKFQGQTVKKPDPVVIHIDTCWGQSLGYVMLGRPECISQVYLTAKIEDCREYPFRVDAKAAEEAKYISDNAINNVEDTWFQKPENTINISTLNAVSLVKHRDDIAADMTLTACDVICVNETFLTSETQNVNIPNFDLYKCGGGRGRGVAMYTHHDFPPANHCCIEEEKHQIIRLQYIALDIISIYISPSSPDLTLVIMELQELIEMNKKTIICGDFNMDPSDNKVSNALYKLGFSQIVSEPTHTKGRTLDHFYVRPKSSKIHHFIHPLYFSDHNAVCVSLTKEDN